MSDRIDLRTSEMKIDDCLQRIEALEQKPCMNITEIFTIEEVTEIKKIIEAINPKIPFNKNRFFGSNFLTDLKKEIAELKVSSVRQTEILKVITEGRILELDAYNRLESVLKKFMIMQEKMQNAMSPCSYDEEWYFHPLHKLIDELSGEKESSALSTILEEKESNEWDSATNSKPPEPEIYTSGIQIRIDMEKNELIGEFQSDFDYVWFIMETEGIFDSVTPGDYKKLHVIKKKWEGKG